MSKACQFQSWIFFNMPVFLTQELLNGTAVAYRCQEERASAEKWLKLFEATTKTSFSVFSSVSGRNSIIYKVRSIWSISYFLYLLKIPFLTLQVQYKVMWYGCSVLCSNHFSDKILFRIVTTMNTISVLIYKKQSSWFIHNLFRQGWKSLCLLVQLTTRKFCIPQATVDCK